MDVPEEVVKAANAAWTERLHKDPEETPNDALRAAYLAEYAVVTEWVRKQTLRDFERVLTERVGPGVAHRGGSGGTYTRSPNGTLMEMWSYGNAVAYTMAVNEVLELIRETAEGSAE
jgi:hypothetical protein